MSLAQEHRGVEKTWRTVSAVRRTGKQRDYIRISVYSGVSPSVALLLGSLY